MKLTIEQAFMLRFLLENSGLDGEAYRKLHTKVSREIRVLLKAEPERDSVFHTLGRLWG